MLKSDIACIFPREGERRKKRRKEKGERRDIANSLGKTTKKSIRDVVPLKHKIRVSTLLKKLIQSVYIRIIYSGPRFLNILACTS